MFCGKCGSLVPANASFCPRCGKLVVAAQGSPTVPRVMPVSDSAVLIPQVSSHEAGPDSAKLPEQSGLDNPPQSQVSAVWKGAGKGRYLLTVVLTIIFAALLGSNAFVFLSDLDPNPEKAGETLGKSIIPLAFWFVMALLAWRGIKSREPDSELRFRLRHRRFKTATSIGVVLIVLVGFALGVWNSHRIKVADAIRKLAADNADLQSKGVEFRHQLSAIRHRDTPTMLDYYNQCMEVEKLLDDYEPNRARASSLIQKMRRTVPSDDQSSAAMFNGMDDLLSLDDKIIRDLRQEVAYSKVLITLPSRQQTQFYSETILPVQKDEDALVAQETKKLEEVRALGVQLPADLFQ
jgi:hypothetical protein